MGLILLCIGQVIAPIPDSAIPSPAQESAVYNVDLFVLNQVNHHHTDFEGKVTVDTRYYLSLWDIHYFNFGTCTIPLWEYRGWLDAPHVYSFRTAQGLKWSVNLENDSLVIADYMYYLVSEYDFEYENRYRSLSRVIVGL